MTFNFFVLLGVSWIFSKLPVVGSLLGNLLHLLAIIFYIGFSSFFVYKIYKQENLEIALLDEQVKKLETFLE
ncbi:MAG: hypothetical protein N3A69_06565 [Leptospiraceae bacterium]|nr:hypothetical protein [Leptospiraceae bacterium]